MSFVATRQDLRAALTACCAGLLAGAVLACGASEPTNPLPTLTGVTPSTIIAGSPAATLTLTGTGFLPGSQVLWNDAGRITHYQSATTLTVDLQASDLATVMLGKVSVMNGPPGGGASGTLDVAVGSGVPQITALSPAAVPMQSSAADGGQTINVTGTGFVAQSFVRVGTKSYPVTVLAPTRLVVLIPYFDLFTPGTNPLTVVNPGPGGGTSNALDFGVIYPVPTLAVMSPDSSFVGAPALTLTVTGTGFGTDSHVQWNGQDRTTTFVSTTKLTANVPATDVATATAAMVTVRSPVPGGGTSAPLAYRVVEQAPVITGINPGFVIAGSGSTTITISGTNFRPGATAQWNGANRSATLVNATTMTMTLTAADVATLQTGMVTVTNPGGSGISNALAFGVVSASPSLAVDRTLALMQTDLVYDPLRNVLYASVPDTASQYAGEIVRIDPTSGAVTGELSVGNPGPLAITDDGQFLYVGLRGAPKIVRVALATLSKDIDIAFQPDTLYGNLYAADIQPIPGAPKTIAVSTFTTVPTSTAGTFLFVDGTQLPAITGSYRLTRGPDASRIYAKTSDGILILNVTADGLHEGAYSTGVVPMGVDFEYDGGFIYGTSGGVLNVLTMSPVGTIPILGWVRPDAANARVHFLNANTIWTYHYTTLAGLGSFSDPSLADHRKLVRWGTDGLAVGGGATIVLLRGVLVAP